MRRRGEEHRNFGDGRPCEGSFYGDSPNQMKFSMSCSFFNISMLWFLILGKHQFWKKEKKCYSFAVDQTKPYILLDDWKRNPRTSLLLTSSFWWNNKLQSQSTGQSFSKHHSNTLMFHSHFRFLQTQSLAPWMLQKFNKCKVKKHFPLFIQHPRSP